MDHDGIRSQNPLLSLFTNAKSPNIDKNCNFYDDQYADDDYASSVNYDSYISHTNDIVNTDDINDNNFQEPFMSLNSLSAKSVLAGEKLVATYSIST